MIQHAETQLNSSRSKRAATQHTAHQSDSQILSINVQTPLMPQTHSLNSTTSILKPELPMPIQRFKSNQLLGFNPILLQQEDRIEFIRGASQEQLMDVIKD